MTFDLGLWPTDLNINRGLLLIKDYLPTKFEASGTKRCWVISVTGMTFNLHINRGHLLITDYLPTKFEAKRSWVISCTKWSRLAWPLTLTFWPEYQLGSSTHPGLSTYQVWSFLGKTFLSYQLHKVKGYWHTARHVQSNMPLLFQRGGGIIKIYRTVPKGQI